MKVFYDTPMAGRFPGNVMERLARRLVLNEDPDISVVAVHPSMFTMAERLVSDIHDLDYVRSVVTGEPRDLAESNGYIWREDDYQQAICRTAGIIAAAVDAADHGLTGGTLSPGMHRAGRARGADGCTFNGLAAAAWWVVCNRHDYTVVVFDLSAGFAVGTSELIAKMDRVHLVDLSTDNDDWGADPTEARRVGPPEHYIDQTHMAIEAVLDRHPDIVIANMSIDPDVSIDVLAARDRLVADAFRRAEVPVAFSVGQEAWRLPTSDDIAAAHHRTIEAFAA